MSEPSFNRPYGPITFAELTAGLVWPRLLRGLSMSVRPSRVLAGTAGVALMWGVARLVTVVTQSAGPNGTRPRGVAESIMADIGDGVAAGSSAAVSGNFSGAWRSLDLALTAFSVHSDNLLMLLFACAALLPVWALVGGALCRSVAVEVSGDADYTLRRALVFSLRRLGTMLRAILLPLGLAAVISLLIKAAGWVLFSLPGVSVVGAVVYPLMVIGGLLFTLVWVGFMAGHWLLIPAIAVENTDATDAVQRAYSYVLGRPARTLAYMAVSMAAGAVGLVVVTWLVGASENAARVGAAAWLGAERAALIMVPSSGESLTATILLGWGWLIACVSAGWAVSYAFTASTLLYLLLRRVHDEQDPSEVWKPKPPVD